VLSYQETIDYLYNAHPAFEKNGALAYKPGLDNVVQLSEAFGRPEKTFPCIHIAGTNGKGSCSHLLAAILMSAGYKVGLYTSPHVFSFRERIKINGEQINETSVIRFVQEFLDKNIDVPASFFEITTVMAFDYFRKNTVDIAIIETGMGGRLDATNIIQPLISVITNVSLDHVQYLGHSVEQIAHEKSGIIKPFVPIVLSESHLPYSDIIHQNALKQKSPIYFADETFEVIPLSETVSYQEWNVFQYGQPFLPHLQCGLLGHYQKANIKAVLQVLTVLSDFEIPLEAIYEGCRRVVMLTSFMGRWQLMSKQPMVILDAAHNDAGIELAMTQLKLLKTAKNTIYLVIGCSKDKSIDKMLSFIPADFHCNLTAAQNGRAMPVKELASYFEAIGRTYTINENVNQCIENILSIASKEDIVWIGGSIYLLGDITIWRKDG
jgi:dihydrofolate synthase/folylpolyglutamate synthase